MAKSGWLCVELPEQIVENFRSLDDPKALRQRSYQDAHFLLFCQPRGRSAQPQKGGRTSAKL